MSALVTDLCLASDVVAFLALPTTDTRIQGLVSAVSAAAASYCGRAFQSQAYSEQRNGMGARRMMLAQKPVTAVASVTSDGAAIPAGDPNTTPGWFVMPSTPGNPDSASEIVLNGWRFSRRLGAVTVAYTAGYVTPFQGTSTVPPDLAQAVIETAALRYREIAHLDKRSEGLMQQQTNFLVADFKPFAKLVLDRYRKVTP